MASSGEYRSGESDYKISQNIEQPYRSYYGDPFLSFSGVGTFTEELVQLHRYCHSTACPLRAGVSSTQQQLTAAFKDTKLQSCGKCRNSWYCSVKCQQHDWVHGGHRGRCSEIRVTLSLNCAELEIDALGEHQSTTDPISKAYRGLKVPDQRVSSKRIAKNFSFMTFEEKCTMEFLYSCGILQTIMSDTFHRRANCLPPSDAKSFSFPVPVHAQSKVRGMENVRVWEVAARKFTSWMRRCCSEGPDLHFSDSIPLKTLPHVHVVVHHAIQLLQSWEPQQNDNWAMQREATVLVELIAGFGHQQCFVDAILTPGASLHSYVQLLLKWAATWRGPPTHQWSRMMQTLLSALLSGLELSETRHSSPSNPAKVAVLEPVCVKFVCTLAADTSRFCCYTPEKLIGHLLNLDDCPTHGEKKNMLLEETNDAICFSSEAVGHDFQACLRARRYFSSLDLGPLGQLAAFHKEQLIVKIHMIVHNARARLFGDTMSQLLLSTGVHNISPPATVLRLCNEVLAAGLQPCSS